MSPLIAPAGTAGPPPEGEAMRGGWIGRMSWDQVEERLDLPVLLPIGAGAKEHGLHLPLNTDELLATYLTERVLERKDALALPVLTYGFYPAFLEYPGSISIPAETMRHTVVAAVRSLLAQGARKFYAINTGISTLKPLKAAKTELHDVDFEYLDLTEVLPPGEGTHADEQETSMMLVIAPDRVEMHRAQRDCHGPGPGPLTRKPDKKGIYSPTGAYGDPTRATAELGRKLLHDLVEHIVQKL